MLCYLCICSATWPPGVRRLAQAYLNDPFHVYVGSLDLRVSIYLARFCYVIFLYIQACTLVEQSVEFLNHDKKDRVSEIITSIPFNLIASFVDG